jgi:hypothetical protein
MVLQIGLGNWGRHHNRILKELGYSVYVCEIEEDYKDVLKRMGDEHGSDVEFVVCTTNTMNHFPIIQYCLQHKIPLYCEKPICLKKEHIEILRKLDDGNARFMANHQMVFHPDIYGRLGKYDFYSNRTGNVVREEGALMSLSVHDIAIAMYLHGWVKPSSLKAIGCKTSSLLELWWEDGTKAQIFVESVCDPILRNTLLVSHSGGSVLTTIESWKKYDIIKEGISYFGKAIKENTKIEVNNLEQSLRVTEVAMLARDNQNKAVVTL